MALDRKTGQEVPDNTPVAIPVRIKRTDNLFSQIKDTLASEELRRYLNSKEVDTPEEADDFDIPDDYDHRSPYEMSLEQELRGPQDDENERVELLERSRRSKEATEQSEGSGNQRTETLRGERSPPKGRKNTTRGSERRANRDDDLDEE